MSMRRRSAVAATAALLLASAGAAEAQDFDVSINGYGEFRAVLPSAQSAWTEGGLGKLQFDGGGHRGIDLMSDAVADLRVQAMPELSGFASLRLAPNQKTALDVTQAYARLQPVATAAWNLSVKLGAFFPPVSLENEGVGWTSPWTITPSAINSWVGDELKTIGGELTLEWRTAWGALGLTGAVYAWNDPAGALLADRGWAFDDHPVGLLDNVRLPNALATRVRAPIPLWEQPFREIDNEPGWYAGLSWRQNDWGRVALLRYENRANPALARGGEFAWRTEFTSLGVETYLGDIVILAQAMSGLTEIAPVPTFNSTTNFQSAYLLAGTYLGDWRLAARIDGFATQEHHPGAFGVNLSEHGTALALAATWSPERWLRVTAEVLYVASLRGERAAVGLPARVNESQLQIATRLMF